MTITVGGVGAAANVGVLAVGPTDPVAIGTPFAFTINVNNAGPAAATNVQLTDTLPPGTQFVSATTSAGVCQHTNGRLLCSLGTLNSGNTATIVLTVRPTIAGAHTNQAVISADQADPVATNNSARDTDIRQSVLCAVHDRLLLGPDELLCRTCGLHFRAEKRGLQRGRPRRSGLQPRPGQHRCGAARRRRRGFGAPALMTTPDCPESVAVADFNNDGHARRRRRVDHAASLGVSREWPRRVHGSARRSRSRPTSSNLAYRGLQPRRQRRPRARRQRRRRARDGGVRQREWHLPGANDHRHDDARRRV